MSIKITDKHPEYSKRIEQWTRCRDAIAGEDEVKAAGPKYLPRLPGQSDDDYAAWKLRAVFYNATARTLDGLTGLVLSKEQEIKEPTGGDVILEDVDLQGTDLEEFAEEVLEETLGIGRCGILIDSPVTPKGLSKLEAEKQNIRPCATLYHAEAIINWAEGRVNGRIVPTRVVLCENYEENGKQEIQYRELRLDNSDTGYSYSVTIWRKSADLTKKSDEYIAGAPTFPQKQGKPLGEIPFWFSGPEGSLPCAEKPPLNDLVIVNFHHYRTMADLQLGRFFCGMPLPIFAGFSELMDGTDKKPEVKFGSPAGLATSNPLAKAYYLEYTGTGLGELRQAAEQFEMMMSRLGARFLAEEKRAVETAEAVRLRSTGETTVLGEYAKAVSRTITAAIGYLLEWAGVAGDFNFEFNTDYMPTSLDGPMLTALVQSWQAGAIGKIDLFNALQKGQIIADSREFKEYEADTPEPGTGFNGAESNTPPNPKTPAGKESIP